MEKQNNKIPLVRFPEFKGEYAEHRLSELLTRHSKNNKDEEFGLDDILSLSSIYGIVDRKKLLGNTYDKVNHKNYIKTRLNDFVYGKSISASYPYGLFKVNNCKDGLLSTLYFTFKVYNNTIPTYLDIYFSYHNRANNFLKKYVLVGDRYITANANYILSGKIFIPQLKEQKKIAHFFKTLDQKINKLEEKKRLLESYKKGMMQKIFSQKLRFKNENGEEFEDWEVKKLGEVFSIGSGKDYKHLSKGRIPVYGSGGYMTSVNEYLYDGESVCIGRKGTIDKPAFFNGKFWTVDTLFYTHSFIRSIPKFIFYLFLQINWKKYNEASGVPSLSKKTIESIIVELPPIAEQNKIANFLSKIDKKIENVNQQLAKTKQYKKGMLQRMFCIGNS